MASGKQPDLSPQPAPIPLIPVGVWIRIDLPDHPCVVGFTYVDPEAGFSAQGWTVKEGTADQSSRIIIRLPMPGVPWRRLEHGEVQAFGLESLPSWVAEFYGPQPPAGSLWGAWREHPKLKGRFLPNHPDDLQVIVHDGGPRTTQSQPELIWVTVLGMEGDVFRGRLLNQPHNLQTVREGSKIAFIMPPSCEHPIMVTEKYLRERGSWVIHACQKCGLSELFDAPSDLMRVVFPNLPPDAEMNMFTAFCPLCGGVQGVESRNSPVSEGAEASESQSAKRRWWKCWG